MVEKSEVGIGEGGSCSRDDSGGRQWAMVNCRWTHRRRFRVVVKAVEDLRRVNVSVKKVEMRLARVFPVFCCYTCKVTSPLYFFWTQMSVWATVGLNVFVVKSLGLLLAIPPLSFICLYLYIIYQLAKKKIGEPIFRTVPKKIWNWKKKKKKWLSFRKRKH